MSLVSLLAGCVSQDPPAQIFDRPVVVEQAVAATARTPDSATPWAKVRVGPSHACGVRESGQAACWRVDESSSYVVSSFERDWVGTYRDISSGTYQACGLATDGSVLCEGCDYRDEGQCEPRIGPYQVLSVASMSQCALTEEGEVDCWGYTEFWSVAIDRPAEKGFTDLDVDGNSACAKRSDGTLHCWGTTSEAPQIPFNSFDTGEFMACGVRADNAEIECWSDREEKQELISTIPPGPFVEVHCAGYAACARTATGELTCWGEERPNGLISSPPQGVKQFDLSNYHGVALMEDGTIQNWGGRSLWLDDGKD